MRGRRKEKSRGKFRWAAALILYLAGVVVFAVPDLRYLANLAGNLHVYEEFRENSQSASQTEDTASGEPGDVEDRERFARLYEQMKSYNQEIFENHQMNLNDPWAYEQSGFDLSEYGIEDGAAAVIEIPRMDVELPVYLGATEENMARGAVHLGQTSMPVGGENTNCVIAAHRGYGGAPMFREIENLEPGDRVEITNLWETLSYVVEKSIVIAPDDIEAVKILEGRDMVTLVTCHPYTENYQRYVVYCRREDGQENAESDMQEIPFSGIEYQSSVSRIRQERMLNAGGAVLFAGLGAGGLIWGLAAGKSGKKKRTGAKRRH